MSDRARPRLLSLAVLTLLGLTACNDDSAPDAAPPPTASRSDPGPGLCDDLAAAAGSGPWSVEEYLDDDGATCTFTRSGYRADLTARYGDLARRQFELTSGELKDRGFPGFVEPVVTAPTGWWSEAYGLESVVPGVARIVDVVHGDDLTVRLLLVGTPATGYPDAREDEARSLADAFLAAVPTVLGD